MTPTLCNVLLPEADRPISDLDVWVRFGLGHRRMTSTFATALDDYVQGELFFLGWSAQGIVEGWSTPLTGIIYEVCDSLPVRDGDPRFALTAAGVDALEAWFTGGDPTAGIAAATPGSRAVLLVLAGHGTGPVAESELRSSKARATLVDAMAPNSRPSGALCAPNSAGMTRVAIQTVLAQLVRLGADVDLGLPREAMDGRRVGQYVRRAVESGHATTTTPQRIRATDAIAILQPPAWAALRRHLRGDTQLDEDSWRFAQRLASRSSVRAALPLHAHSTAALEERDALTRIHEVLASVMRHHPGALWGTATHLSTPTTVHPKHHPREGHPTVFSHLSANGQPSGDSALTHRTPDGSAWFDPGHFPDVLIEYESVGRKSRIVDHLEFALWTSSMAGHLITLVIATTTQSAARIERAIDTFVSTRQLVLNRIDWPNARVNVRIARIETLRTTCPLHGSVDAEWMLST